MKYNELTKRSINQIVDRDTTKNAISYSDATIFDLINKLADLKKNNEKFDEFLIVFTEKDNNIKMVLTSQDVGGVLDAILQKKQDSFEENIGTLNLEKILPTFSSDYIIQEENTTIGDVIKILATGKTNVLIVSGNNNEYLGKITRTQVIKYLEKLLDN